MKLEEKLALDFFRNDSESHILIDQEKCKGCEAKICISICPGGLYSINEDTGELTVEYAGCLECGSCLVACPEGALSWSYPRGGFGVQYRYG